MERKNLLVTSSPHIVDESSTRGLMLHVVIALCPALVASVLLFGGRALLVTAVTTASCVGFEALWCLLRKQPVTVGDLSSVVTGLILAFNLPATIPPVSYTHLDVYKRQRLYLYTSRRPAGVTP